MKNIRWLTAVLILALLLAGCAPFLETGGGGSGYKGGEADFLDLTGVATPEEMQAALGEPEEILQNENPGYKTLEYRYGNVSFGFEQGENGFVLNGLYMDGPDERFTVGGAGVGMTPAQAEASLAQHGFALLEDATAADTAGGRYYEAGSAGGPDHMIVAVYTGDGLANTVYGYAGLAAGWALDQLSAPGGTGEPAQTESATYEALDHMGVVTTEDVAAALGEPDNINENETPGFPIIQYAYPDTLMEFVLEEGGYLLSDISCTGPQSPFTVGGARVGMALDEAEAALAQHGFVLMDGVTDEGGRRCYQHPDADAPYPATVLIWTDDAGQVGEVSIYWACAAQWLIENRLQGYGAGTSQTGQENGTQPAQTAEFLDVIGANTPEDVIAALGEPETVDESENPGYPAMDYSYPSLHTIVSFEKDGSGTYVLNYIKSSGPASPFTVCGVSAGMALEEAEYALEEYGLFWIENATDELGTRFYHMPEGDDPYAPVVAINNDANGTVTAVTGHSGLSAQWVLDVYATWL